MVLLVPGCLAGMALIPIGALAQTAATQSATTEAATGQAVTGQAVTTGQTPVATSAAATSVQPGGQSIAQPSAPAPSSDAALNDLIPDAAVKDPELWALDTDAAKQAPDPSTLPSVSSLDGAGLDGTGATTATTPPTEVQKSEAVKGAQAPETFPGITIPWPDTTDLPPVQQLAPDPDISDAESVAREASEALDIALPRGGWRGPFGADAVIEHVGTGVELAFPRDAVIPEADDLTDRFAALSSLRALDKSSDNLAQISRRAREDSAVLLQVLHLYGYYDAEISQSMPGLDDGVASAAANDPTKSAAGKVVVRFEIVPGMRYQIGELDIGNINHVPDAQQILAAFALKTGDPANTESIQAARDRLIDKLGTIGYAFAKVDDAALSVDHETHLADLTIPTATGGKYVFGQVTSSMPRFINARHLQRIARFRPGRTFDHRLIDDFRQAVLATGFVGSVKITPREVVAPTATSPGVADIDVKLAKGPQHTIAGQIGQSSGEGFRLEASWEDRNFFPPEGMLRFRAVLGTREQLAGVTFRRSNFLARDQALNVDLYAQTQDTDAYNAHIVSAAASIAKQTTLIFQKAWSYSLGVEVLATSELAAGSAAGTARTTYFIGALPGKVSFDRSDNLLDPTKGFRIALAVSPEISVQDGPKSTYVKSQFDASVYQHVTSGVVLAARTRIGTIRGTVIDNIAPSRRFYAGGGASIRGFGYQSVGPKDSTGTPVGALSLSEFSLEARIKTGIFGGGFSIVPFVDAGMAGSTSTPTMKGAKIGAGIGVRYKTPFGPIRLDVGTPLNPSPGDNRIGVYVALGQAF
ncbi:surface antigen (D15) [Novosphingobium nitrogenifigens DSM 19370]|uniref:Surface antigen (D15) n=1 Tax=Novosphingobium nitrogenifigens DSM 19370 TaxID=983920 RepID=F1ZD83_9SPHN|nr:surface antigen (D15) [Novosphingobium nitrogenifigens DSM 19370]